MATDSLRHLRIHHGRSIAHDLQVLTWKLTHYCAHRRRARDVPDWTVISGESRSLTGTPRRRSPAVGQVGQPEARSLQAADPLPCTIVLAQSFDSRPNRCRVASANLDT